jgi:RNA polymerase sigma-70 factor (ECF subfamily)
VNETHADLAAEVDPAPGEEVLEADAMDVLASELGRLKRIVAGMGLDTSDGEDVLQDVSIRVLKQTATFKRPQDCIRWLIKVTVNRCLMEYRSRNKFRRQAREILKRKREMKGVITGTVEKAIVAEELEIVRESMKALDDSLLVPMVLQYFCDLNSTEVGRILGLNPSTVRSRLREGRMILAKRLLERGVGP